MFSCKQSFTADRQVYIQLVAKSPSCLCLCAASGQASQLTGIYSICSGSQASQLRVMFMFSLERNFTNDRHDYVQLVAKPHS
jgi:hypothetical protein